MKLNLELVIFNNEDVIATSAVAITGFGTTIYIAKWSEVADSGISTEGIQDFVSNPTANSWATLVLPNTENAKALHVFDSPLEDGLSYQNDIYTWYDDGTWYTENKRWFEYDLSPSSSNWRTQ